MTIMSILAVNHQWLKQGNSTRWVCLWSDCKIKKERKWFMFLCIVKSHSATFVVCSSRGVSGANEQLESFITMTHQLLLSRNSQLPTCPTVLSLQLIIICFHSMWRSLTADILWQPITRHCCWACGYITCNSVQGNAPIRGDRKRCVSYW